MSGGARSDLSRLRAGRAEGTLPHGGTQQSLCPWEE